MRTVRSDTRSRNVGVSSSRPPHRRSVGVIATAIVALSCSLASRAWAETEHPVLDDILGDGLSDQIGVVSGQSASSEPPDPEFITHIVLPIPPRDVVAAAYRAAALADNPTRSWGLRSRLVGLVPSLSTRIGRDQSWRDVADPTLGYRDVWDVRATWHVDRLLFDPNEFRISTIDITRRRERRRVAGAAIHLYYRWLKAEAAAHGTTRDSPRWAIRSSELLAELDALTEGWFSAALAKRAIAAR